MYIYNVEDLEIIIESYECFVDDDQPPCSGTYLIINGERIESNGNHLQAVLEYLGYNANVNYI